MTQLSRFNVVSRIKDSDEFFLLNSLYGSADIIDKDTFRKLSEGKLSGKMFTDRGYLVDPETERAAFRAAYLKFIDDRETDEVQLFFVPGYTCNFDCSYCYQCDYDIPGGKLSKEVADAFFSFISDHFSGRRKYITLFGGEPLLPGKTHKSLIEYIIGASAGMNTDIALVTNGYHLSDYFEILEKGRIREVQVTLDGTRKVHDSRRCLKNGRGTFNRIVRGIDSLLDMGIPVNLRMVADRENINNLPDLAGFAIQRGWTSLSHFSTQIGRNYELHDCQADRERLFSRVELQAELYRLIKEYPHILDFHRPAFSVSRSLYETGELPPPLFDACPGTKTEWAFDYTGKIFSCTATVGKKGEELGSFFPEKVLFESRIEEWQDRDILSINECVDCNLSLLCGGGCAAVGKNRGESNYCPDCRPVRELLELGISAYFTANNQ